MLHIPPEFFFPESSAAAVAAHDWVIPDFADADGNVGLRTQALIVEIGGRTLLVDPCVGNFKPLAQFFWNEQEWPFMDRFSAAGFSPSMIDTVVHTHVHADHVGWDTHLVDGEWIPTFTNARHLYTVDEMEFARATVDHPQMVNVYHDSIEPIIDAGLVDLIAPDADLGDGMRLESTPGHTPGHVSMWIESQGERALITGDFLHHPVQCAEPLWSETGDTDADLARATRRRMLTIAAETGVLFVGTHFPTRPAGRVTADGDVWRFVPA
jgi:glyoxylase-like metal-dependent hydrolase (beta-lactamase superfamily II)